MNCKYCGKSIDNDSIYCRHCGLKVDIKQGEQIPSASQVVDNSYKMTIDGEEYTVRDGIVYDEEGWDVGRLPYGHNARRNN